MPRVCSTLASDSRLECQSREDTLGENQTPWRECILNMGIKTFRSSEFPKIPEIPKQCLVSVQMVKWKARNFQSARVPFGSTRTCSVRERAKGILDTHDAWVDWGRISFVTDRSIHVNQLKWSVFSQDILVSLHSQTTQTSQVPPCEYRYSWTALPKMPVANEQVRDACGNVLNVKLLFRDKI